MQEKDAGWNAIGVTKRLSKQALDRFKSMASNVIYQKNLSDGIPPEVFFIQSDGNFMYICNLVSDCAGDDKRGNSFIHGYIISKNEYYRRCIDPLSIMGMKDSEFIKSYNEMPEGWEQGLPIKNGFCNEEWNVQEILQKYKFADIYSELIACTLSVLGRRGASLCVCVGSENSNELKDMQKEILFCIMEGLPKMLRAQFSCSTSEIGKGKVYFSPRVYESKQEFIDLMSGECVCRFSVLNQYSYIGKFLKGEERKEEWAQTELFFDIVFGQNGCSLINHQLIESVYTYYCNERPTSALESLYACLEARPAICPLLFEFFEYLLPEIDVRRVNFDALLQMKHFLETEPYSSWGGYIEQWMNPLLEQRKGEVKESKEKKSRTFIKKTWICEAYQTLHKKIRGKNEEQ